MVSVVPLVDANPELHTTRLSDLGVALCHGLLDGDRALDGVHDAIELSEDAVAGRVYDATAMLSYQGQDHSLVRFEVTNGGSLVSAHEAAIAGDIGSKDRGDFAGNSWISGNIGHPRATDSNTCG